MKKLMIAAAIVCAAAFAHAANFNWGFNNDQIFGPEGYVDGDGYLLDGNAYLYIADTLIAGPANIDANYPYGSFDYSAVDTTGKVQTLGRGEIDFVGQAYKLVLQTLDGKYEVVVTGTSENGIVPAGAGEPVFNYETFISSAQINAGDWQSVPEPTSGLLLLLGVAGLALKRKRA